MARTLLIDADITAYQICSSLEQKFEFAGETVYSSDLDKCIKEIDSHLEWVIEHTSSDAAVLMLTGPDNYRKRVLDTYKGNRVGVRRPENLKEVRAYMQEAYMVYMEPTLEGDDLLGIHATMPHKGERVIYSADKDLRTVPGLHWCPEDGEAIEVTPHEGDTFFFEQILTGDPTDNYKGCPGVGKVAALAMLEEPFVWEKTSRPYKSGPRKGQEKIEWVKKPIEVHNYVDIWRCIVSFYEKAGLTEQDALVQARCARILRHGEYDFQTQEVKLWNP